MPHPATASPAEIDIFLKAASQRYTELGVEPARAQQLLAATLGKLAGEAGVLKQAVPVITPAANAINSGAQTAGEAWGALPDPVRSGIINALIGGTLVGGGTAAMNYAGGGEVNKDQVLRNALMGAAGGALTPAIANLLQGVLGKMSSADLLALAEGIVKHAGMLRRLPQLSYGMDQPSIMMRATVRKSPLSRAELMETVEFFRDRLAKDPQNTHTKEMLQKYLEMAKKAEAVVKAVPTLKRNPSMSKKAQAFVVKVRQLLKHTNAG
jgi:hypothetical protein